MGAIAGAAGGVAAAEVAWREGDRREQSEVVVVAGEGGAGEGW